MCIGTKFLAREEFKKNTQTCYRGECGDEEAVPRAQLLAIELENWRVGLDITAKVAQSFVQSSPAISSAFALHLLRVMEDQPNWRIATINNMKHRGGGGGGGPYA